MLDRDLAELYGVENKVLGQQVKRNSSKFPSDFMFKLSPKEIDDLRSQIVTANISSKSRVPPAVFSEHGVLMLANVLNSERANNVSIQIIRIFTKMREMIVTQNDILLKIEQQWNFVQIMSPWHPGILLCSRQIQKGRAWGPQRLSHIQCLPLLDNSSQPALPGI